jgi:hypothetical protein
VFHYTRLERLARDERFSLLGSFVSYEEDVKKCCEYGHRSIHIVYCAFCKICPFQISGQNFYRYKMEKKSK